MTGNILIKFCSVNLFLFAFLRASTWGRTVKKLHFCKDIQRNKNDFKSSLSIIELFVKLKKQLTSEFCPDLLKNFECRNLP